MLKGRCNAGMMTALQRVERETVSSQNMANAFESTKRTRTDSAGSRLRLEHERLYWKNWSGSTPLGGFARKAAAWLGYVDPKHGKWIQQITTGTLRATEAWTCSCHATHDKYIELDYVLAVAATEGAARSTVLQVT